MKTKKTLLLISITLFTFFECFSQNSEIVFLSGKDAANTVEWNFFCTDGRNSGE